VAIVGAGGFGGEILEIFKDQNKRWKNSGILMALLLMTSVYTGKGI